MKVNSEWLPITEIPADAGDDELSISSLCFSPCGRYLFVARLNGLVYIFNVSDQDGLVFHMKFNPGGGAIWHIQFNPYQSEMKTALGYFQLAIACDDGSVRIFSPDENFMSDDGNYSNDSAHFNVKNSPQCSGRTLCVSWCEPESTHDNRNVDPVITCGDSEGGLRWINSKTCKVIDDAKIPAGNDGLPISVWTIQSLFNGEKVVSADDRGILTVWNSSTASISSELRLEGLDCPIWCSSILKPVPESSDITVLFGAADGSVSGLVFHKESQSHSAIRPRRVHTHDIRSIASCRDLHQQTFMTASTDSKILSLSTKHLLQGIKSNQEKQGSTVSINFGIVGKSPMCQVIRDHNLLVSTTKNKDLEFWTLEPRGPQRRMEDRAMDLNVPKFTLKMSLDNRKANIMAFAVSPDARLVAMSDFGTFRLYSLRGSPSKQDQYSVFGDVKQMKTSLSCDEKLAGAVDLTFCGDYIIAVSRSKKSIILFNFVEDKIKTIELGKGLHSKAERLQRVVSTNTGLVSVADSRSQLYIAKLDLKQKDIVFKHAWQTVDITPPGDEGKSSRSRLVITSLAAAPTVDRVLVGTSDTHVTCVNLSQDPYNKDFTCETQRLNIKFIPTSITIGPNGNALISGTSEVALASFKVYQSQAAGVKRDESPRARKMNYYGQRLPSQHRPSKERRIVYKFQHIPSSKKCLWSTGVLSSGDIVLVQKESEVIQSCLPDAIPKKTF